MKKRKILIPIICCSLLGSALAVLPFVANRTPYEANATYVGEVENPLTKTYYYLDEEVSVSPKDIVYNNKVYICSDFYVRFPDGSQKSGTKFRLNQTGEYDVVYISKQSDKVIEATEKIYAYQKAYSVVKEASSSEYVDQIVCEANNPTGGIVTWLAEGDTWTYNQAIDISKADLSTPLIKYYTRQSSELANHVSIDVTSTIIRLTDFYDETNYVEILNTYNDTNPSTHRMQPYVMANAYGQIPSGIDLTNKSSKTISYEGVTYFLHNVNRAWGSCLDTVPGSTGINGTKYNPDIANSDNRGFSVFYNAAKKSIYVQHRSLHLVTDLDEPAIYSNNLFKGFTTGEVILSMRCEGYKESLGYFEISEIYGKKGAELNSNYAFDEKAPVITLTNNADNFYIANGEPFTLFGAKAADPHLYGEVTAQVYYDYQTNNQRFIPVTDGKFTPTFVGKYTIVYSARDTYGNVATRTVTCNSISAKDNKIVSLDFNPISSADAGSLVTFAKPVVSGYNEGKYCKVTAINAKNYESVDIDLDNMELFLKYAGQYTIRVTYGDIACRRVQEFEFNSLPSSNTYLNTKLFPKYFIRDAKHSLDNNLVVLCDKDTPTFVDGEVYIKNDDGAYDTKIDPKEFEITASNSVQFKYIYNGATVFESEQIPVVDVDFYGNINFSNYFVGTLDSSNSFDGVLFSATSNGNFKSEFINPLSFDLFRCEVLFETKTAFRSVKLVMKDYEGVDNDFEITFFYNGTILSFMCNGINGEIGVTDTFSIAYDAVNKNLAVGNGVAIPVKNPFRNDKFYLSFEVTGAVMEPGLEKTPLFAMKQLNNQVLSSDAAGGDFTNAQISYTKLKGQRNINSTITIGRTSCVDVLTPYLVNNQKVRVTYKTNVDAPNSDAVVVSSTDGVKLDGTQDVRREFDVLLDKHGVYLISYSYTDQFFNSTSITEIIYVDDNEAPVISINGATNNTVDTIKLGEEVTLRGYTVSDESAVTVTMYAISPTNEIIALTGKKFTPTEKGDWHIVYYAKDANFNVSSASYIVRVK